MEEARLGMHFSSALMFLYQLKVPLFLPGEFVLK